MVDAARFRSGSIVGGVSERGSVGSVSRSRDSAEDVRHNFEEVRCRVIPFSGVLALPPAIANFRPVRIEPFRLP